MNLVEKLSRKYSKEVMEILIQLTSFNSNLDSLDVSSIRRLDTSASEKDREEYFFSVINELLDYSELQKNYRYNHYYHEYRYPYPTVVFRIIDGNWFTIDNYDAECSNETYSSYRGPYSNNMMILKAYQLACKYGNIQLKKRLSLLDIQAMNIDPAEADDIFIKGMDYSKGREYSLWYQYRS